MSTLDARLPETDFIYPRRQELEVHMMFYKRGVGRHGIYRRDMNHKDLIDWNWILLNLCSTIQTYMKNLNVLDGSAIDYGTN